MSENDNFPSLTEKTKPATVELVKEFLDNQTRELELKTKRFELEKQQGNHS